MALGLGLLLGGQLDLLPFLIAERLLAVAVVRFIVDHQHLLHAHQLAHDALQHLAFGLGIHSCPGALLSRTEARIALTRINERLGELHLDAADIETFRPSWRPAERVRGLSSLPVRR